MLKIVLPFCINEVRNLFNEIVNQGSFPEVWKVGHILPIPKTSTPTSINDLRPICILSAMSKIFEKIIYKQINSYVEREMLIPNIQSGFRTGHGTQTALLKV